MSGDPEAAKSIFMAALDIASPEERKAYLDEKCAGDAALRDRVEDLLRAHEKPGSFLNHEAAAQAAAGYRLDRRPLRRRRQRLHARRRR